ncbi:MAG: cell division protein ZapA [Candidatus Glassbacteria bacterium]
MVDDNITSTRVTIFGETYNIRSQADPEYTSAVAEHVDNTMQMIKKQIGMQDPLKIAILASMSITDELFQAKENSALKSADIEEKCNSLLDMVDSYLNRHQTTEPLSQRSLR